MGDETDAIDPAEGDLCRQCGLCCNGAFHVLVKLQDEEVALLSKYPLEEHPTKQAFLLPCSMHEGVCTIYEDRPAPCRDFTCGVLLELRAGEITYDEAVSLTDDLKDEIADADKRLIGRNCAKDPLPASPLPASPLNRVLNCLKAESEGLSATENFQRNSDLIAFSQRLKRKMVRFEPRLLDDD